MVRNAFGVNYINDREFIVNMKTIMVQKEEHNVLRIKQGQNLGLFAKLVRGLEDIREGRIKPWVRSTKY